MTFVRQSQNEEETAQIGQEIAQNLIAASKPVTLALHGTLGAGKSSLARSIIRFLSDDPALDVPSPTFTIVQEYQPAKTALPVFHFDLYRLDDAQDLLTIGVEDYFADGHCLIEWPDKAGALLPKKAIHIRIDIDGDHPSHRIIMSERLDG